MTEPFSVPSDEGHRLTVARVREGVDYAEVTFYESARFYRLLRANPAYKSTLQRLRAAATIGKPLHVRFVAPKSDVIESVRSDE
jgi:hypothetical protein